jgi:MFS family permease
MGAFTALRGRDFRLLWGGQTISLIGDGAFVVAMSWKVIELTGSSSSLAILLLLQSAGLIATVLIGGALADRYPRRTLMIVSDLARFGVMAAVAALSATGDLSFHVWLVLALAYGLADGFFYPAFGGIVPLVVEQHLLPSANAVIGMSRNLAFVVGPALAGLVYGTAGSSTVFALNAASFVVSAGLLARTRPREPERGPGGGTFREILEGARYVASVPWLWVTIAIAAIVLMVAVAPLQSLLPRLVQERFHQGVASYGSLWSAQAVGMFLGAFLFGHWAPRRHRVVLAYGAYALNDVSLIALVVLGRYHVALVLFAVRGLFIGFANAIWETVLVELVPEDMLGRVASLDFFGSFGLMPVGFALTAAIAGSLRASTILLGGFSLALLAWTLPLASRRVRSAA